VGISEEENVMWKYIRTGSALLVLVMLLGAGSQAQTISIQPFSSTVDAGNMFTVDVTASGVTDLFAFQFDVDFDPTIISAVTISEGPTLSGGGSTFFIPGSIDNGAGSIQFTTDTLIGAVPGVTGNGVLATLSFNATSGGISPLKLSNVVLLDSSLGDIHASTLDGQIRVTGSSIVPEPTPLVSFIAGLTMCGVWMLTRFIGVSRGHPNREIW
jgi:general secretion pathway protein D